MLADRTVNSTNEQWLCDVGLLLPPKSNGYRTIFASSCLSSGISSSDETFELPTIIDSVATLQFCGLDRDAAHETYKRYSSGPSPYDLVDFAKGFIQTGARQYDACSPSDDWDGALRAMGICHEKRLAIMHPSGDTFRGQKTASGWAIDIVEELWAWILDLDNIITRSLKKKELRCSSRPPEPGVETVVDIPEAPPGSLMLYKGGSLARLEKVLVNDNGCRLEFANLWSTPPTDFSPMNQKYVYLAKQRTCAEEYAGWASRLYEPTDTGILYVAVPKVITDGAIEIFGDDCKRLVFESRAPNNSRDRISADLRQYTQASLLVGSTCSNASNVLAQSVTSPTGVSLMELTNGEEATQYAFNGDDMTDKLNEECVGKVWIEKHRKCGSWRVSTTDDSSAGGGGAGSLSAGAPSTGDDDYDVSAREMHGVTAW